MQIALANPHLSGFGYDLPEVGPSSKHTSPNTICEGAKVLSASFTSSSYPAYSSLPSCTLRHPPMVTLAPITVQNAFVFKAVRLRALQDTPYAFGSTYATESQFPGSEWLSRARRWNGERGIGYLAMDEDAPCGIAGAFLDQNDPTRASLVSMWTAPTHRQCGVGRLLVNEILRWAHSRGVRTLLLMVTDVNQPAIRFYGRLGFRRTGVTEPYPNDSAMLELEMSRPIP